MSTTLHRILRNGWRVGFKGYLKQMNRIGDTKAGTLIGQDVYGNQFFENTAEDEIHLRTRWVEYKEYYPDMSKIEPAWHYWLAYGVDVPPTETAPEFKTVRSFTDPNALANYFNKTGTRGAYVPYNTVRPKYSPWTPKVQSRT